MGDRIKSPGGAGPTPPAQFVSSQPRRGDDPCAGTVLTRDGPHTATCGATGLCQLPDEPTFDPLNEIEIDLLLDAVVRRYGYDFRQYSSKTLLRRLQLFRHKQRLPHLSQLIPILLHEPQAMNELLLTMSVTVTEFFRDPAFFAAFRERIVPVLRTYPFITLWCAGCASGEEAYSWAILLHEQGLLERSRIYATDFNHEALDTARRGVYSQDVFQAGIANYRRYGGARDFADYGQTRYGSVKLAAFLSDHITFARHNLVHDGVFGEMVVIACRNVMIYFNAQLKAHCLKLFHRSLTSQGFLCLGESEALDYMPFADGFTALDKRRRLYQKAGANDPLRRYGSEGKPTP